MPAIVYPHAVSASIQQSAAETAVNVAIVELAPQWIPLANCLPVPCRSTAMVVPTSGLETPGTAATNFGTDADVGVLAESNNCRKNPPDVDVAYTFSRVAGAAAICPDTATALESAQLVADTFTADPGVDVMVTNRPYWSIRSGAVPPAATAVGAVWYCP